MGASNHSLLEREENDFYATDPSAIDDLLKYETFDKNIWECAVGQGHLAERLKQYGYTVECTDLIDRGYPGTEIVDFLNEKYPSSAVCYAWFIWVKGEYGVTELKWIY